MLEAVLIGLVQGIFEWLPVSSEGLVTAVYVLIYDAEFIDGVSYAIWVHVGTAPAAVVALRSEMSKMIREIIVFPPVLSTVLIFLVCATVVSAGIGFPLLLMVSEISDHIGSGAMGVIGAAMVITGLIQMRNRTTGVRKTDEASLLDGFFAGIAQGFSVVPGLSRSGLTLAVLLGRRYDREDALVLSFLMSVPASIGAGLYSVMTDSTRVTLEMVLAAGIAFLSGLAAIKLILRLAMKINLAGFVTLVGVGMIFSFALGFLR